MSAAARWSYTAKATHWPSLGKDDWSGGTTYGLPVTFLCDYKAERVRTTDAGGVSGSIELGLRQVFYTEYSAAKQGDFVLIGASSSPDPVAAGAAEVRSVGRSADTFDRVADDYEIMT